MPSFLGYRGGGEEPEGRYAYVKEIIADPHLPCLLQRVRVRANPEWLSCLKTYVLCAPHLDVGGAFDINNINKLEGRFWVGGLPFPNARHLGHPFQWKSTLPWHLEAPPPKSESSASKSLRKNRPAACWSRPTTVSVAR